MAKMGAATVTEKPEIQSPDAGHSLAHPTFKGLLGVGLVDITPPPGIYHTGWGAAKHDAAEGVHQPLTATALALRSQSEDPAQVLLAVDLGWWAGADAEWKLRSQVLEALQLDPARLLIHLSHTHAAPSIRAECRGRPGGHLIAGYLEQVRDALIYAGREALRSLAPATLDWNYGRCSLAANRDFKDPQAERLIVSFNPQKPADDTLLVGRVTAADGRTLATLVNYACHPTTLGYQNRLISPDFVGSLRETVEGHTGGAPCLFLQGASGNLAPKEQYTADLAIVERHGRQLGYAALSTLEEMLPPETLLQYERTVESGAPLGLWSRAPRKGSETLRAKQESLQMPLRDSTSESERGWSELSTNRSRQERILRKQALKEQLTDRLPLWVWRVGDCVLVGQPNEAYSEYQVQLRARFPGRAIAVLNFVNGPWFGYLPTRDLYSKDLYPVWQTPFAQGALEHLLDEATRAIEEL